MSTPVSSHRFIKALLRQPVDVTPVWIMRQAGRYLPEYRQVREQAGDFLALCKTPELACRVTLQPLERFPLDAAILFSDILTIPDAMGLGLSLVEKQGPVFAKPVRDKLAIQQLGVPDPSAELRYVTDAIHMIRKELNGRAPLIGFSGSPWTLATYMVEGRSSKNFSCIKAMLYEQPDLLHELLDKLAQSVVLYLNAQIEAGVDAVMLFDTWGGVLTQPAYREFSLQYMQQIVEQLDCEVDDSVVPVILFSKGIGSMVTHVAETGCHAVGLDWTQNIADVRKSIGDRVALQGNLDPAVLYASEAVIRREVGHVLEAYGNGSGHVFNLGHGIHPEIDPDRVAVMVDAVHELSKPFHETGDY
ncbi:MAG TPA: uroporphyrinogen decarboxylase [Gammaproteobacteria bacterium]|nr:uroporphyrinogen decarboxylase [Gammaproteobacteria bacterium]